MYKLFIIAPYFPPSALPPSHRVRLLVRHLKTFDYYPTIFTTDPKYREEIEDAWMVELAGDNFKKISIRSISPILTRKIGIGDLGLRWLPFLFPKLLYYTIKTHPDFILYPVPPWYILIIAPIIKFFTGVPYGIDFIDSWVAHNVSKKADLKKRMSQFIANKLEYWVVKNASIIYSVSNGINRDLVLRYPKVKKIPMYAIPYGVEPDDFKLKPEKQPENSKVVFRYIGAVWEDAYQVLETLFKAFGKIKNDYNLSIEFFGTSYASKKLAKPQLNVWKEKYDLNKIVEECQHRVTYRKAVQLTIDADILILFGGMSAHYAASKLMGIIASAKPFIGLLHRNSFPGIFLQKQNYPYLVLYSEKTGDLPGDHLNELIDKLQEIINNKDKFVPIDMDSPEMRRHTAYEMTKQFIQPLELLLKKQII